MSDHPLLDNRKPLERPRKVEVVLCIIGIILCFVWAIMNNVPEVRL